MNSPTTNSTKNVNAMYMQSSVLKFRIKLLDSQNSKIHGLPLKRKVTNRETKRMDALSFPHWLNESNIVLKNER